MAFSKTPDFSTYQTKMVNLLKQENHRADVATQDEDYLNCFIELVNNQKLEDSRKHIIKRAGTSEYIAAVTGSTVRGMHYNEDFRKLYYAVGRNIYVYNVSTGAATTTLTNFFASSTGDVGFCDYLYDNGTQVIIATDGTELGQITSAEVITMNADADMPAHIPLPVFLDGYLFIVKSGTADIYNSDLNNPLSWTPGDFISAEVGPDLAQAIVKLNNYLVVFGTNTIEYFWDAANASGSPLQRNDTPIKFTGYLGALATHGNRIYFMGHNRYGHPSVFMLEDFKIEEVASPSVIRHLALNTTAYSSARGVVLSSQGHTFYILTVEDLTYVLDLDTKLWSRWAFQNTTTFPARWGVNTRISGTFQALFVFTGETTVYKLDASIYQDDGTNFTVSGVTDNQFFDTYSEKSMNRLVVWADRPPSSSPTPTMSIQWSDDDYLNYSSARTLTLYQDRPSIDQLGRFRRRAFKWSYTVNLPLRLKGFEVMINMGQN